MILRVKSILGIFLATVWISVSEFVRNEFLLKSSWESHYSSMGLDFPDQPTNGVVWGFWSLGLAILCFLLLRRFSLWESTFTAWFGAFVLMWLVVGNLSVLPFAILWWAVPLSILECFIACRILVAFIQSK